MDSPQVFISFGAIMLVVALLGVAIDWFGKPLRHRRFVAKIYRFPDERQRRRSKVRATDWSDRSLILPVVEPDEAPALVRYPDPRHVPAGPGPDPRELVAGEHGPPTAQVPVVDLESGNLVTLDDVAADSALVTLEDSDPDAELIADAASSGNRHDRRDGWALGGYIFNYDDNGAEPKTATVETRYWKNVGATAGATVFGQANVESMNQGEPPRRTNRRTGQVESMTLPKVSYHDTGGETPVPTWPSSEIDPFQ